MNKIERAIYDAEMHLKEAQRKSMLLLKEIEVRKENLETLISINDNKQIPNEVKKVKGNE